MPTDPDPIVEGLAEFGVRAVKPGEGDYGLSLFVGQQRIAGCVNRAEAARLLTFPRTEASTPQVAGDGWRVVPVEPTVDMCGAALDADKFSSPAVVWEAMLASAPLPLVGEGICRG